MSVVLDCCSGWCDGKGCDGVHGGRIKKKGGWPIGPIVRGGCHTSLVDFFYSSKYVCKF